MNVDELLKTKLLIPPVRKDLVERARLFRLLDECLEGRLGLVSAPPGYGKTTLLSAWARGVGIAVAWLSLDEADNDPARFLGHLCASLEAAVPALFGSLLEMARAEQFGGLGAGGSVEAFQTRLINKLQTLPEPVVLVLDDYHLISAQVIHRLVAFLVEHAPPQLHQIISSRADPPLPLARLRARGHLVEIRQNDLRLTSGEAMAFLNQVMGLGLDAGDVVALSSRTEGWIAGLQLAAASMHRRSDLHRFVQDFKGSNRYVLDYLAEEVLLQQPQEVRTFLLRTSILERLTAPLCDAVVGDRGWGTGQGMLEYLEHANLFIVPLDDERRWYRYHRLFADLLRKQLGEIDPEMVPPLHRRASAWYQQNGQASDAVGHALAGEDFGRAAQLVEGVAQATLMRGEATTLLKWLDALPESELHARPMLSVCYAWIFLLRGAPLDLVEARLSRVGEHASLALPLRAWMSQYRGDMGTSIDLSRRALELLPEDQSFLRGLAVMSLASAHHANGDVAASQRVLLESELGTPQTGNMMIAVYAAWYRAERCRREGDLRQAKMLFERALELATDPGGNRLPIAGQILMGLGDIAREWNDLETATRHVLEGIELAQGWSEAGALDAYQTLARIRRAQQDWSGVHEALQGMRQVAIGFKASDMGIRAADMAEAWMLIAESASSTRSDEVLEGARRWAERYDLAGDIDPELREKVDDVALRRLHKYEYLVVARLRMAEGRPADALSLLESALPIPEKLNRTGLVIEYLMIIALAEQALGRQEGALRSLERVLDLAEPGGFLRIFLDEGVPMARLLHEAASRGMHPGYVSRLLSAFLEDGGLGMGNGVLLPFPIPNPPSPTFVPLSERELEVLGLIAEGMSNDEIARRLVVSLPTIKFHTSNIYDKLSVRNRTEAVAKARILGLIPLT